MDKQEENDLWANIGESVRSVMEAFYSYDVDSFMDWLDERIVWVNTLTGYVLSNRNSIRKVMERRPKHEFTWKISDEQYSIVKKDPESCIVSGTYVLDIGNGKGVSITLVQQLTFHFILVKGRPKVTYMHHSHIWADKKYDDIFFRHKTFDMYERLYQWAYGNVRRKRRRSKNLTFRDIFHITHVLTDNEIIYVSAQKRNSILHCLKGCIEISTGISKVLDGLPEHFLRVHRSYLVNMDYVIEIGRNYIMLAGGIRIPVPARQYVAVKKKLSDC